MERINEFKEAILEEGDKVLLERIDMTIQPQVSFWLWISIPAMSWP